MPTNRAPVESAITMWGPPGSGKSTFLAALDIALIQQDQGWRLIGEDDKSTEALIRYTTGLSQGRRFPPATQVIERHSWRLIGALPAPPRRFSLRSARRREQPERVVQVGLDLVDTPGELASPEADGNNGDLIEVLARSSGLVFFFDPIREFKLGDSFDHVFGVVARLAQRMETPAAGRLPHRVAVCITKFDELRVFESARRLAVSTIGDDVEGLPQVPDYEAREFFAQLCEVSGTGKAEMLVNIFERYFIPERVRYFVTSAIGFYVDPRIGRFDPDDPQNVLAGEEFADSKGTRIRGPVRPVNVVEPILWLASALAEGRT